jgi:tRNA C32,U32 (ribose-2'-O)-methylase TrmJ
MKTPAVILINPKSPHNVGKALRAASMFGAKSLVWTGARVDLSQYDRLPREAHEGICIGRILRERPALRFIS